jgi:hypothetical protein
MQNQISPRARVSPVFILAVMGCSASGDATFSTALPPDTVAETLPAARGDQLCADARTFVRPALADALCTYAGWATARNAALDASLSEAQLKRLCRDAETSCRADLDAKFATGTDDIACKLSAPCRATVAEFVGCVNDDAAALRAYAGRMPTCDEVTRARAEADDPGLISPDTLTLPMSCVDLNDKCPNETPVGSGGSAGTNGTTGQTPSST